MSDAPDLDALTQEVERLRAERDELAAEAERLGRRARGGAMRRLSVGLLVLLSVLTFTTSVLGYWANRNLLDTEVWIDRVGPLASDPAVQVALAAAITDSAMDVIQPEELFRSVLPEKGAILAVPLSNVVRGFVGGEVQKFVASETFADIWTAVNRTAHEDTVALLRGDSPSPAVEIGTDRVTVSLVPAIDAVLRRISIVSPEIFGKGIEIPEVSVDDLPASARQKLSRALGVPIDAEFGAITVYDGNTLSAAQDAIKVFDRLLVAAIVLTVVLTPVAVVLSRRRRRTTLQLLAGFSLALVLIRRLVLLLVGEVTGLAEVPRNAAAVDSLLHAFADPLLARTGWLLAAFGLALVLLAVTGPYGWAVRLREIAVNLATGTVQAVRGTVAVAGEAAAQESTVVWVRQNASALQWAGAAAFVVVLWWLSLSWVGLLLLTAAVGAFELWVSRLAAAPEDPTIVVDPR